ncbi:MAG: aldo/keto reductase [Terrisporobacter sp.]
MEYIKIGQTDLKASRIGLGCMHLGGSWDNSQVSEEAEEKAIQAITQAIKEGINFFDHADIYCNGKSEEVFSKIWELNPSLREKVIIQSKCGIKLGENGCYDFSKKHILNSVDNILDRLKTDYLDILLLHRPDPLVDYKEVAQAFDILHKKGKVRHFGVSNHNPMQMALLERDINQPIEVNQMEYSLANSQLIDEGMNVNSSKNEGYTRSDGTLEYCRLQEITLQAWSPLASGRLTGDNVSPKFKKVKAVIEEMAEEKVVSQEAIALAWVLRHPAKIQPIIGSTSPQRIHDCCEAMKVKLSREEWYRLYKSIEGRVLL